MQLDSDLPTDQANRHRVTVRADGDLAEPVDARGQPGAGLERLVRQRCQLRLLDGEVFTDGVRASADAPGVVSSIPSVDHGIELLERLHLWDWDKVITAEPADLPFDAALLVGPLNAWLAIEGVDADPR